MTVMDDVVVVVPGIMGSALEKDGTALWDLRAGVLGSFLASLGGSLDRLTVGSDSSTGGGVTATHLLGDTHLLPYLWKIDGYSGFVEYLKTRFRLTPDKNLFAFPYDWRLDNRISAERLRGAVGGWLEARRRTSPDARLVLVAHSMGGLVCRYFLEALGGWRDTRTLITLGTPHRGAVKALDFLVNGVSKRIGPVTLLDLTAVVRSLPSAYQLLPIYPCVGETEHDLQRLEAIPEVGELDMDRARAGVEFHREIERKVAENLQDPEYRDARYKLVPVVGTHQPTFLSAVLTGDGVEPIHTYKGETLLDGDGTVPRISATPIELSDAGAEMFVACPHAGLQNFDPVRVQARSVIGDVDIGELKGVGGEPISLDVRDAYHAGEPFVARARYLAGIDPVDALVTDTATSAEYPCEVEAGADGWQALRHPPLPAGSYRIRVDAGPDADPITDVFAVVASGAAPDI